MTKEEAVDNSTPETYTADIMSEDREQYTATRKNLIFLEGPTKKVNIWRRDITPRKHRGSIAYAHSNLSLRMVLFGMLTRDSSQRLQGFAKANVVWLESTATVACASECIPFSCALFSVGVVNICQQGEWQLTRHLDRIDVVGRHH